MALLSRLLAFFPSLIIGLAVLLFVGLCLSHSVLLSSLCLVGLLFSLYGLPLLAYRVHAYFHPISEGISYLKGEPYSPWWGSHQLQAIYIAFPVLETVLRLVPGVFSAWLRLWGAEIGTQVYWGTMGEIADRGLLKVSDRALIGHRVGFYAHIIKPKRQNLLLYVKHIEIGEGAFIGSGSSIGAGVVVEPNAYLEAGSEVHPNQSVAMQKRSATQRDHPQKPSTQIEIEQCVE